MADVNKVGRGRDVVEGALIQATRELLAETGPGMSLRDIAERAGVNKGQIHHYFGGKAGLVEAAFRSVSREHFENWEQRKSDDGPHELTLTQDDWFWQVLVRLVLEGELDTASIGLRDGTSVPRALLEQLTDELGLDEADIGLKAEFATAMAIELGWAAFSPFIKLVVGASDADMAEIMGRVRDQVAQVVSLKDPTD